jgi:nucleoside-diphosphate-sugar epimerase
MILLIGENSFIAKNFIKRFPNSISCSHLNYEDVPLENIKSIINLSFHPDLYIKSYNEVYDIDSKIAQKISDRNIKYIMVSSRKVYGDYKGVPFNEMESCNPIDHYGDNKYIIENNLKKIIGKNLYILRAGNIFGNEFDLSRKRLGSYLINQLIINNGSINLGMSKETFKNIISIDNFLLILNSIAKNDIPRGIYNVGSNSATKIGVIAKNLIIGYGGNGRIFVHRDELVDPFDLDTRKLKSVVNNNSSDEHLDDFLVRIGKTVRNSTL